MKYVAASVKEDNEAVRSGSGMRPKFGQATKGVRWMPQQKLAMKDVASCDKPRGAAKQALIRGFPNRETVPPERAGIRI